MTLIPLFPSTLTRVSAEDYTDRGVEIPPGPENTNMNINNAVVDLAYAIRNALSPHLGAPASRQITGKASSGDESFAIDDIAEQVITDFIREHELPVAYYTEGFGLVEPRPAEHMLVIDPIDGTRPAMRGLEPCVVSIAVAPNSREACMSDVTFGCILELKADRLFTAERCGTASIRENGRELPITRTDTADLDKCSWSFEVVGRPFQHTSQILAPLVNMSGLRGGVYVFSSTAFSLTRMLTGQFDAVMDVGNRIFRDHPELRDQFVEAGFGNVIGLFPYDIAAAAMIAETAGCVVTDAYGKSLGPTPLLDTTEPNIRSITAASNPVLHEKLIAEVEAGMTRLAMNL